MSNSFWRYYLLRTSLLACVFVVEQAADGEAKTRTHQYMSWATESDFDGRHEERGMTRRYVK